MAVTADIRGAARRTRTAYRRSGARQLTGVLACCVILGMAAGIIKALFGGAAEAARLAAGLELYFSRLPWENADLAAAFWECLVKYGKFVVIIWFLAFLPHASVGSFLVLFAKGMSLGFTVGALAISRGAYGLYLAAALFLPQNAVLLPAYIYLAKGCMGFASAGKVAMAARSTRDTRPPGARRLEDRGLVEYLVMLLLCLACVVLAALIEVYAVPALAGRLL